MLWIKVKLFLPASNRADGSVRGSREMLREMAQCESDYGDYGDMRVFLLLFSCKMNEKCLRGQIILCRYSRLFLSLSRLELA